ncbi:histidine kinase [Sphingomonas sp. DT-207]|uniref:histidine kinase n=1 Tax=Sphingomonas sp. DT-207 TaxID=3396167 RepID=UPI003F1A1149
MMWRYLVGAVAALLLAGAGIFLFRGSAAPKAELPRAPSAQAAAPGGEALLPEEAPRASDRTREQKRFDRYDKDRNDAIAREEYFAPRRKAFAKLDLDRDGKLSFEEWAVRTTTKFAEADKDKSATLTRTEFTATAPKRKPKAACVCGPGNGDEAND